MRFREPAGRASNEGAYEKNRRVPHLPKSNCVSSRDLNGESLGGDCLTTRVEVTEE